MSASEQPVVDMLDVLREIWALQRALDAASLRMERTIGVSGPQRLAVRFVGRFPGISPNRLAHLLRISPGSLSRVLQGLEAKCAIVRSQRPGTEAALYLGTLGRAFEALPIGTIEAIAGRVMNRLSPDQARRAVDLLALLAAELEQA